MIETRNAGRNDDPLWTQLSESLSAQMGFHLSAERRGDFERGIAVAASAFGMESAHACASWLLSAPLSRSQIETLARCLTVGETYFFRDHPSFEVLQNHILPELVAARVGCERRLRIWSAGCCTGEEPYSIAMLLCRLIPDLPTWDVSILATDIDPDYLRKASLGTYSEWSFRDIPAGIKEGYFKPMAGGRYQIDGRVRDMVRFAYLNLADNSYPSRQTATEAIDIVFCRNVLMYFEADLAMKVVDRLGRSLGEGGWLLVSPVEIAQVTLPQLVPVRFQDAIVHRKQSNAVATAAMTSATPVPPSCAAVNAQFADPADERTFAASTRQLRPNKRPASRSTRSSVIEAIPPISADVGALFQQGRYDEVAKDMQQIVSLRPDDAAAITMLAKCCANLGRLDEAAAWCARAMAIDKLDAGICCLLANIHQQQGQMQPAMRAFQRALYLDPNNAMVHFSLGNLIRDQNRKRDADQHFRTALAILESYLPDQVLAESGGLTAGRLAQMVRSRAGGGNPR